MPLIQRITLFFFMATMLSSIANASKEPIKLHRFTEQQATPSTRSADSLPQINCSPQSSLPNIPSAAPNTQYNPTINVPSTSIAPVTPVTQNAPTDQLATPSSNNGLVLSSEKPESAWIIT